MRQKRIALINDMTGFGRCSIAVELPLISALKIQACPLPTAILSVHTGFKNYFLDDYTEKMKPYMESWQEHDVEFDGICTGFLGSAEQIDIVIEFIEKFRKEDTKIMVDPVMGDNGKIYSSYTPLMCKKMKKLLHHADLVTPNLTEACELLDMPYPSCGNATDAELLDMAKKLSEQGPAQVVITGISRGDEIHNFIYEKGVSIFVSAPKIGTDRSGTGDAFAAIVAGKLVNGHTLKEAVQTATDYIGKCLKYSVELDLPWNYGLPFEEYLTELR